MILDIKVILKPYVFILWKTQLEVVPFSQVQHWISKWKASTLMVELIYVATIKETTSWPSNKIDCTRLKSTQVLAFNAHVLKDILTSNKPIIHSIQFSIAPILHIPIP